MSKSDSEILRDVAAVARQRRLDGRTFPAAVDKSQRRFGRDPLPVVRHIARLIQWRHADLPTAGVVAMLDAHADELEGRKPAG